MNPTVKPMRRVAVFLVAFSVTLPGFTFAERVADTAVPDLASIRIDNFGRVNAAYYRGAEPGDGDYATLAGLGIKRVLDLRGDDSELEEQRLVEQAGMKYTQLPMTTHRAPTPEIVQTFLKIVTDPANQPVYVHCVGGRHRTGVMTAIYRMSQEGWTAARAFKEMKDYNFGPDFLHPELKRFVYGYRDHVER